MKNSPVSAAVINIHASCVAIKGWGVLLLGESGAGKSDLALRLIDEGARLVADDRCDLFLRGGKLWARPPSAIAGLLEMRGIGIIAMPHVKSAAVALAVHLSRHLPPRLPSPLFYKPPARLKTARKMPLIVVNASAASAPARIRAALRALETGGFRDTFNPE